MARVLLIDDDIAEISAVKRVLSRGGHQAVLATSIADALTLAEQERPAAAVISASCENGGGAGLARRLAEDQGRLPVLVLGEEGEVPAGAVCIPRPLDPSQLAEELQAALKAAPQPVARIPLATVPKDGRLARAPAAGARSPTGRRAAADALKERAAELRRERSAPAEWLEAPPPAATAAPATAPADPPSQVPEVARRASDDALVAEIDAELDRLTRGDPGEGRGGPLSAEELADEIARRAEEEADRRRAETEAQAGRRAEESRRAEGEARRRAEFEATARARDAERRRLAVPAPPAEPAEVAAAAPAAPEPPPAAARPELAPAAEPLAEPSPPALEAAPDAEPAAEPEGAAALPIDPEEPALAEPSRLQAEEERLLAEADAARQGETLPAPEAPLAAEAEEGAAPGRPAPEVDARRRAHELAEARAQPLPEEPEPLPPPRQFAAAEPAAVASPEPARAAPELPPPPAELVAGTLAEAPMPRLLALSARESLTGRLDFGSAAPRSIYFEEGRVVGASSGSPQERVEEVALRLGLLTREQHRQVSSALAGLSPRRGALLLLERGFLKPEELTPLVRRRTEEVVFALFGEVAAPFRYAAARVPPEDRIALGRGPLELALDGVRRKWLEPRLAPFLGGPATLLAPAPRAPSLLELGLSPEEVQVASLADGLRTLDEVQAGSPLGPLPTRQLLAGLLMVGSLASRFRGGDSRQTGGRAIDLARLRDKLDQVRRADYFTILGLSRHATPFEVREAAARLLAEFDPARFHGQREPGLEERLEEVRRVLAEARDVLADDGLREEYVEALGTG
ncbi:MAG TPA: DUF4388 domain-containing protein [Anaeromyxobacteraceae bacterium]|nr:DUF4388 domain-containing protein [Anaeromyxobacteraceae bacterium]